MQRLFRAGGRGTRPRGGGWAGGGGDEAEKEREIEDGNFGMKAEG